MICEHVYAWRKSRAQNLPISIEVIIKDQSCRWPLQSATTVSCKYTIPMSCAVHKDTRRGLCFIWNKSATENNSKNYWNRGVVLFDILGISNRIPKMDWTFLHSPIWRALQMHDSLTFDVDLSNEQDVDLQQLELDQNGQSGLEAIFQEADDRGEGCGDTPC